MIGVVRDYALVLPQPEFAGLQKQGLAAWKFQHHLATELTCSLDIENMPRKGGLVTAIGTFSE